MLYYTIKPADVRSVWARMQFHSTMGRILPHDVGKRIYRVPTEDGRGYVFQVENEEQFQARRQKTTQGRT